MITIISELGLSCHVIKFLHIIKDFLHVLKLIKFTKECVIQVLPSLPWGINNMLEFPSYIGSRSKKYDHVIGDLILYALSLTLMHFESYSNYNIWNILGLWYGEYMKYFPDFIRCVSLSVVLWTRQEIWDMKEDKWGGITLKNFSLSSRVSSA